MTKGVKTSKAVYKTLRINPETSQEDADLLAVISQLESEGYTFKQIVQDAILRADGKKPEMYSRSNSGFLLGSIEEMFTRFASEVMNSMKGSGRRSNDEPIADDEDLSPFASRMAKSFLQRQQNKGDE